MIIYTERTHYSLQLLILVIVARIVTDVVPLLTFLKSFVVPGCCSRNSLWNNAGPYYLEMRSQEALGGGWRKADSRKHC